MVETGLVTFSVITAQSVYTVVVFSVRCKSVWAVREDASRGGCQAVSDTEGGAGEAEGGAQKCTDFPPQGKEGGEGGDEEWHRSGTNRTLTVLFGLFWTVAVVTLCTCLCVRVQVMVWSSG